MLGISWISNLHRAVSFSVLLQRHCSTPIVAHHKHRGQRWISEFRKFSKSKPRPKKIFAQAGHPNTIPIYLAFDDWFSVSYKKLDLDSTIEHSHFPGRWAWRNASGRGCIITLLGHELNQGGRKGGIKGCCSTPSFGVCPNGKPLAAPLLNLFNFSC